jgi:hypothetical protein
MLSHETQGAFELWVEALGADKRDDLSVAKSLFESAAKAFYDLATSSPGISSACYEYSTLMDAFCTVENCREYVRKEDFDVALDSISKAGEIFRTTLHFAFLSPYVAACAGLEVLDGLEESDPDRMQACKNSIALFEQAKLVLSFRDEKHPIVRLIDGYLNLGISKGLECEAKQAAKAAGSDSEIQSKLQRSENLRDGFKVRMTEIGESTDRLNYLPVKDCKRAIEGSFLLGYPDADDLSILNVGSSAGRLVQLGGRDFDSEIPSGSALRVKLTQFGKMKIRMLYEDTRAGKRFDEGCISLI